MNDEFEVCQRRAQNGAIKYVEAELWNENSRMKRVDLKLWNQNGRPELVETEEAANKSLKSNTRHSPRK